MISEDWTSEAIVPGEVHCHQVIGRLHSARSRYQTIEVINTRAFGRGLLLDGRIQHLEHDEFIYSETIVHPAALALGSGCKRVLVIGGGPGGAIREVLKHKAVTKVVQVEIDPLMVEISQRYFPHISNGFHDDPRFCLMIDDVRNFTANTEDRFDLIIFDVSEPRPGSPAEFLFTLQQFARVRGLLDEAGIFVTWAGAAGPQADNTAASIIELTAATYPSVELLLCHAQSYGTSWLFAIGSRQDLGLAGISPREIDDRIRLSIDGPLNSYDGISHSHLTSLPKDLRRRLERYFEKGRQG